MTDIDTSTVENSDAGGTEKEKERKFRLLSFVSFISVFFIPLLIVVTVLLFLLTSSGFYTSILRHSDLIITFVQAKKWHTSEKIRTEIEEKTGLESFKGEFRIIEKTYQNKLETYNTLNKTREYDRLVRQRDELSDLSWRKAPSVFKDKAEFRKYKDELSKHGASPEIVEDIKKRLKDAEK